MTDGTDKGGMSLPRCILPGRSYLVTRRCTQRQFWLKPTALTTQIMAYCLAWAAFRTGVLIHAVCVMSNHYHLVLTDPDGRLPEFLHVLNLYSAKCINASCGRWENLWASEQTSAVCLEGEEDLLDKIAYCLANPTLAGLVRESKQWPGLRSCAGDIVGSERVVDRPKVFFRENGSTPEQVTLKLSKPKVWDTLDDDELAALVESAVEEKEQEARDVMKKSARHFAGVRKVLAQRASDSPLTAASHRQLNPTVAAKNKWARQEALRRIKSFTDAYFTAYELFAQGIRNVVFPAGTYALRRRHGVPVADTA
jgi:putative transposase